MWSFVSVQSCRRRQTLGKEHQGNVSVGAEITTTVFISIGEKYYLSDFIKFENNNYPSGSYLYYDDMSTHSYLINEIYKNIKF